MVKDFVHQVRLDSLRKKAELFKEVQATDSLADTHRRNEFMSDLLEVSMKIMSQATVNVQQVKEVKELEATVKPGRLASFLQCNAKKAQ